ncbi:MAG: hypothetical protein ACWGQW_00770 [bacterium]
MKGQIIEDDDLEKEETAGVGLECPNCNVDMRKVTKIKIKARYDNEQGKMETSADPSVTMFVCDECGYTEELRVEV